MSDEIKPMIDDTHKITDEALLSLAFAAEQQALVEAFAFTLSANPETAQKLYERWCAARTRMKVTKAEGMTAIAGLIADFIQSEECPHCRRHMTAQMFALAHDLVERGNGDNQAPN